MIRKRYFLIFFALASLAGADTNKSINVEAFYIPTVGIWEDDDKVELDGTALRANVHSGDGWGLRAGSDFVGLSYLYTRHDVNSADDELESHSVYLDFTNTEPLANGSPIHGHLGIGLGGVLFDFSNPKRGSRGGGAIMGRLGLRAYLDPLFISAGGGAYLFGYPGETLGYGAFALLSVGIEL